MRLIVCVFLPPCLCQFITPPIVASVFCFCFFPVPNSVLFISLFVFLYLFLQGVICNCLVKLVLNSLNPAVFISYVTGRKVCSASIFVRSLALWWHGDFGTLRFMLTPLCWMTAPCQACHNVSNDVSLLSLIPVSSASQSKPFLLAFSFSPRRTSPKLTSVCTGYRVSLSTASC